MKYENIANAPQRLKCFLQTAAGSEISAIIEEFSNEKKSEVSSELNSTMAHIWLILTATNTAFETQD